MGKPEEYLKRGHFFGARSLGYVMDKASSVDIDDEIDFALAELLMARRTRDGAGCESGHRQRRCL